MHCNGACKNYKAKSFGNGVSRYDNGQKRCHECEIFLDWEGLWCPCCGHLLRSKPRAKRAKVRTITV